MKALISIGSLRDTGLWEGLQGLPLALLPIAGKPIIEYYIDFCNSLCVEEILILDSDYSAEVAQFIGSGRRWAGKVQYCGSNQQESFHDLRQRHANFLGDSDCLCMYGVFFPVSDYRQISWPEVSSGVEYGMEMALAPGLYSCRRGKLIASSLPVLPVCTYAQYFSCCMHVLESEKGYYPLPGYRVEEKVHTGMGLVFPASAQIKAPAIIGNYVRMREKVGLLGKVILGNYVMIDSRSTLQDTIVIENTYVGKDLEIKHKIVCHDKIIDPESEIVLRLDDDRLLVDARKFAGRKFMLWFSDCLLSLLLLLWLTPWLIILQSLFWARFVRGKFYDARGQRRQYLAFYPKQYSRKYLYFYKLMLDKYFLLPHVLCGNLALIGQSRRTGPETGEINFRPGVFAYSETRAGVVELQQLKLDDAFFKNEQGFFNTVRGIKRIAINRLLASMEEMKKNKRL